jgi:hypothetical protein
MDSTLNKQQFKIVEADKENMAKYIVLVTRTGDRSSQAVYSIWSVGLSSVCVALKKLRMLDNIPSVIQISGGRRCSSCPLQPINAAQGS